MKGWVHSWDLSTGVDGPGTRLVVFLTGCPMRCLYCQNPDTWHKLDGTVTELAELEHLMRRYHPFISCAGGGFTGLRRRAAAAGEVHARAAAKSAQHAGLHTALDTSGFLGRRADDALLDATDLVLLDIKAGTDATHRRLTGRPLAPDARVRRAARRAATPVWVRYVLVPGLHGPSARDPGGRHHRRRPRQRRARRRAPVPQARSAQVRAARHPVPARGHADALAAAHRDRARAVRRCGSSLRRSRSRRPRLRPPARDRLPEVDGDRQEVLTTVARGPEPKAGSMPARWNSHGSVMATIVAIEQQRTARARRRWRPPCRPSPGARTAGTRPR